MKKVLEDHPTLNATIKRVLYDSACDDAELKLQFKDELGLDLKASFNPRRSRPITQDLPRGVEKITPYGVPICMAGHEMEYQGIRYASECFIYSAPQGKDGGTTMFWNVRIMNIVVIKATKKVEPSWFLLIPLNILTTMIHLWLNVLRPS